jgi:hypothetical protein
LFFKPAAYAGDLLDELVERRLTDETNKLLSATAGKSSARTPFEFRRVGGARRNPPLT